MKFKNFFGAFALVTAACFAFAFKAPQPTFACEWFEFDSGSFQATPTDYATLGEATTAANYTYTASPSNPSSGDFLYAVCADRAAGEINNNNTPGNVNDDLPIVDAATNNALYQDIVTAEASGTGWNFITGRVRTTTTP